MRFLVYVLFSVLFASIQLYLMYNYEKQAAYVSLFCMAYAIQSLAWRIAEVLIKERNR